MNPFASRITGNSWIWPVSALSLVLGFMVTVAWLPESTVQGRIPFLDPSQQNRILSSKIEAQVRDETKRLNEEVRTLRGDKTRLENAMGEGTKQAKVLNENLQQSKLFAGLTEVEGPGITITLRDSEKASRGDVPEGDLTIHDTDVLRVVNELWNAGAEAVAINNIRVVARSSIRCVGSVILVNNTQVSSPIKVRAIGDPETLLGAMNLRLGVLDEIRTTGGDSMVQIESVEKHRLPPYTGSTGSKFLASVSAEKP